MANLTITAANLVADYQAVIKTGTAGEALSAGDAIYADSSDSDELKMCQFDNTAAEAAAVGIVLADVIDGATVTYIVSGELAFGSILTAAVVYGLSATFGKIAPVTDLASTEYMTVLGVAKSTSTLQVRIVISGAVLA